MGGQSANFFFRIPGFFSDNPWQVLPDHFSRKTCGLQTRPGRKTLVGDPRNRRKLCQRKNRQRRREDTGADGIWKKSKGIGSTKIFLGTLLCIYWQLAVAWDFVCIWSYLNLPSWDCVNREIFKIFFRMFQTSSGVDFLGEKTSSQEKITNKKVFFFWKIPSKFMHLFWLDIFVWKRFSLGSSRHGGHQKTPKKGHCPLLLMATRNPASFPIRDGGK